MFKLTDKTGFWPLELYKNKPIRNAFRIVGMLLLGRAKIKFRKNFSWFWEKWKPWFVESPRSGSLEGLKEFVESLQGTHYIDIRIRHNGKYHYSEGDWIKHLCYCCMPHSEEEGDSEEV